MNESNVEPDAQHGVEPQSAEQTAGRWPQFGLRSLFVLMTIACIPAGFWGARTYREHRAKRAIELIREAGGVALLNKKTKAYYRVHFTGTKFDDKVIAELAPHLNFMPDMEQLDLVKIPVTDKGLQQLSRLRQLKDLYIFETQVTDKGIASLQRALPGLTIKQEQPKSWATSMAGGTPIYEHAINAIAMRFGTRQLVAGNGAGELRWWNDPATPEKSQTIAAHEDWLFGLAYSRDGQRLATGGGDGLMKVWDAESQQQVAEIESHGDDVHAVAFSADGGSLYSVSDDMTVRKTWIAPTASSNRNGNGESGKHRSIILGRHAATIPAMALHPDGAILASASRDETIALWNTEKGGLIRAFKGHTDDVMSIAFSSDGGTLVSSSYDGTVRIWDVETGEAISVLEGHKGRAYAVAISPDGDTIASGGADGLIVWDRRSGQIERRLRSRKHVSCVRFASNTELVAADTSGSIRFIDLTNGRIKNSLTTTRATLASR